MEGFSMAVWVTDPSGVVDLVDEFDTPDETDSTESLEEQKSSLEDDIDAVDNLIGGLRDFLVDARNRISEIDDVLAERKADEDVPAKVEVQP
jgi:hypothetical protein